MKSESEILPCPFCGSMGIPYQTSLPYNPWGVDCKCGAACGISNTKEQAIAAWNTRAPQSPWIKVEDRLPENANDCCVVCNGVRMFGWWNEANRGWRFSALPLEGVTHWMPIPSLPQPPIEKGGV